MVDAQGLLARTRVEKFAVGAFNIDNLEIFKAVTRAARAKKAPVLVELSKGEVKYWGMKQIVALVMAERAEGTELYLNLDHSPSLEAAREAAQAGFDFIHFDGFQNPDMTEQQNINQLQQLEPDIHTLNKILEGEDAYFQGSSTVHDEPISDELVKQSLTDPGQAKKFVEETKVDIFAVSIGNLHGLYSSLKKLDTNRLQEIREQLPDTYFSLHGGSGTVDEDYQKVIELGVAKININSEMRQAYRKGLDLVLHNNPNEYKSYELFEEVISKVQEVVERKIELFGSAGKAQI